MIRLAGGDVAPSGNVLPGPDNIIPTWNTTSACIGSFSNWKWKANPAPWGGIWADHAAARLAVQSDLLFKAYASAGGHLDEIIQDTELGPLFSSNYVAFAMKPSPEAEACACERWNAIQNDERFPSVLKILVAKGLRVNQSAPQFLADAMGSLDDTVDTTRQRAVFDSVMMERAAKVWETAFINPARKYFPSLRASNYNYQRWSGNLCVPSDHGQMLCGTGVSGGAASGGLSSIPMYNGFDPAVAVALRSQYAVKNYTLTPFNM